MTRVVLRMASEEREGVAREGFFPYLLLRTISYNHLELIE